MQEKIMTTDLAAALLADVPLHDSHHDHGGWMYRHDVLAALSRALDPALAERVGEVLGEAGLLASTCERSGQHKRAETIRAAVMAGTALLTANAALRAERDTVLGMYMRSSDEGFRQKARAEAAEAEALRIVMEECYKDREMKLAKRIEERLAALPARDVGVPADVRDYAIDVSEAFDTMMEVERNPAGAWQAIQALAGHIAALTPTDAAQAREAALKVPEVKALVEAARDRVHYWVNELDHCTCGACEPLIAAVRAMEGRG